VVFWSRIVSSDYPRGETPDARTILNERNASRRVFLIGQISRPWNPLGEMIILHDITRTS
jgi:hypothetical protein